MDWLNMTQQVLTLLCGLMGLLTAGVSVFFAIKNFVSNLKNKKFTETWNLIMTIADNAMKEAEKTQKSGADKKAIVIEAVKAGCKTANINIDDFLDQLSAYIDQAIDFANSINNK
nr:MAG TPA: holin [Caudoviricetes sp.]